MDTTPVVTSHSSGPSESKDESGDGPSLTPERPTCSLKKVAILVRGRRSGFAIHAWKVKHIGTIPLVGGVLHVIKDVYVPQGLA
jgi:hypothetical protein